MVWKRPLVFVILNTMLLVRGGRTVAFRMGTSPSLSTLRLPTILSTTTERRRKRTTRMAPLHVTASDNAQDDAFPTKDNASNHANDADAVYQQKRQQLLEASRLSLAPMMEYTDRHFRHLVRLISSKTLLYTEMVASNALVHERAEQIALYQQEQQQQQQQPHASLADAQRHYNDTYLRRYLGQAVLVPPAEGACVLQLGGSDPEQMYQAGQVVMDMTQRGHCDYTAVNINCGCPSPKVAGKGCFGAALMDEPALVAQLAESLYHGCDKRLPVTVKCRIGTDSDQPFRKLDYADINEEKEYDKLRNFIATVAEQGIVTDFSVHARIAVLQKSFSPADNRKIPPLKYHYMKRLVQDFPELTFTLNGGIESLSQAKAQFDAMPGLTGVMIGRAWAADPWSFATTDRLLYGGGNDDTLPAPNRRAILEAYGQHADAEEELGDPVKIRRFIVKAITPLFAGEPNGKKFRIAMDEIAGLPKKLQSQGIKHVNI